MLPKFCYKFNKNISRCHSTRSFLPTGLAYCKGSTGIRLLEDTIGENLSRVAKRFPSQEALVVSHQGVRRTYEEFDLKVSEVAKSLLSLDLQPGAKVGVYAPNSEQWVLTQYACARVGLILVNINPGYQARDLKYALKNLGVNTLILPRRLKASDYLEIFEQICPDLKLSNQDPLRLKLKELPKLKQLILLDDSACGEMRDHSGLLLNVSQDQTKRISRDNNMIPWDDFYDRTHILFKAKSKIGEDFHRAVDSVKCTDATNIQFTSGTTGLPKGAVLSHFNILNNGYLVGNNLNYSLVDKALIQVPLYHCFGSVLGNLACTTHGSTMIYPNGTFDSKKSLEAIEKEKVNSLYGVPTMFVEILNLQKKMKKDVSSLKTGIMAGSVCPKYLMSRCLEELGMDNLTICYGMTELSPVTHQTTIHDSFEKKTSTVGSLMPHTVSKIVDESGKILQRGQTGEICSAGYCLMQGYYNNYEATHNAIDAEGFMKSGDLGYFDDDGYLHIEGRRKDTIIRGGENISPKEIEDYLGTHPMVIDVQVVAVKDERFGDEICAWVKIQDEHKGSVRKSDIINFCKKQIAHYKIPRYVRFVASFPMTVTGKPQKFKMREISNKILKENSQEL